MRRSRMRWRTMSLILLGFFFVPMPWLFWRDAQLGDSDKSTGLGYGAWHRVVFCVLRHVGEKEPTL